MVSIERGCWKFDFVLRLVLGCVGSWFGKVFEDL